MIGLFRPGNSRLHRCPAGWKMLLLLAAVSVVSFSRSPVVLAVIAVITAIGYAVAGFGPRIAVAQVWPLRWVLLVIGGLQWWLLGWRTALVVCGSLLVAVALAALITLTTRVTDLLDLCCRLLRPLRRFGIDPDRVGLVLALTIRSIPLLTQIIGDVQIARKARGARFSLAALVVPTVVRALRAADGTGEALRARGVDDRDNAANTKG